MPKTTNEGQSSEARTGGYFWFPAWRDGQVEWSVLTCYDLGFDATESHSDMWPSVIERLACAWGREVAPLRNRLELCCYGLPRGGSPGREAASCCSTETMPRSPTGAHGSSGDSSSTAARSASVTPSTSGPPPDIARRSSASSGFRSFPLTAGSGNADNERPRRRRRLGLGAARTPASRRCGRAGAHRLDCAELSIE